MRRLGSVPGPAAALLAVLSVAGSGCALLPPPAEDRPLTEEVQGGAPEPIDSGLGPLAEPGVEPAPAGPTLGASAPVPRDQETAVIVVQESPSEELTVVEGAQDTVDMGALERDAEVEPAPPEDVEIVPADPRATVDDGGDPAPGAERPAPAPVDVAVARREIVQRWIQLDGAGADGDPVSPEPGAEGRDPAASFAYHIGGREDAATVLFIHGWCGLASQWKAVADAVAERYGVVMVDLPGHGASREVQREEWTIPGYAADVIRVIREEKLERVILVGHGMGGQVALEVAARLPKRIEGIIGVDTLQQLAGGPDPEGVKAYVERFRGDFSEEMQTFVRTAVHDEASDALVERIIVDSIGARSDVALALMRHFGEHDAREVTRNVQCRVICINSRKVETDVEGNRVLLSSFDLNALENVGHWVHLEAPDRFRARLEQALASLTQPAAGAAGGRLQSMMPMLVVEDMAATSAFYVDALGFSVVLRTPADVAQPAVLMTLERDGVSLVLQTPESFGTDFKGVPVPAAASGLLFLKVSSLDAEKQRLGPDVRLAHPEQVLAGGSRRIMIQDPEGNRVVLQESARAAAGE